MTNLNILKSKINSIVLNESKILLWEWITCYENKLYMASLWILVTFLEKYLRDVLIFQEYDINPNNEDGLSKYDKIEQKIEEDKKKFTFQWICDKLVTYDLLDEELSWTLKSLYQNLRIPVHHGIYKRLINHTNGNFKDSGTKIELSEDKIICTNIEMEQSNVIVRHHILPELFKYYCDEMINILIKIIK